MDLSYNNRQQRRFSKAILKLKFWFNTSEATRDADTIAEDDGASKSRAEKILRSFKRTFRRGGCARYRDSTNIIHLDNTPMQSEPAGSTADVVETPPVPPPRVSYNHSIKNQESSPYLEVINPADKMNSLVQERYNLAKFGWYWGPMTKREAEELLSKEPDGAFLVRDSSSNNHIYTLSLRSYSYNIHTHIEYSNGTYSLGTSVSRSSISELIDAALEMSKESIFSYTVHSPSVPSRPIRLLKPISRNMEVRSLTYLCRFVIRQHCAVSAIEELPLPNTLKQYLLQGQYRE